MLTSKVDGLLETSVGGLNANLVVNYILDTVLVKRFNDSL